jgi:hypothetical protein
VILKLNTVSTTTDHGLTICILLVLLIFLAFPGSDILADSEASPGADSKVSGTVSVKFYSEDIKATMSAYITEQLDTDGVFRIHDEKTGEDLALKFLQVHDPVRRIEGDIYFACTDFHVVGIPEKIYDLDFWMSGETGALVVYESKVHKEPRSSVIYGWFKQPRYTFVNDKIEYLY